MSGQETEMGVDRSEWKNWYTTALISSLLPVVFVAAAAVIQKIEEAPSSDAQAEEEMVRMHREATVGVFPGRIPSPHP